ncbi:MAG: hypothetical protein SVK08_01535 [Halobacteriota archaeon]|nr:hypothetical protein [Halobacteriota archaeon]
MTLTKLSQEAWEVTLRKKDKEDSSTSEWTREQIVIGESLAEATEKALMNVPEGMMVTRVKLLAKPGRNLPEMVKDLID